MGNPEVRVEKPNLPVDSLAICRAERHLELAWISELFSLHGHHGC